MVGELRETFKKGKTRSYEFRLNQLINLQKLLEENSDEIDRALHKDLRRHKMECMCLFDHIDADKIIMEILLFPTALGL